MYKRQKSTIRKSFFLSSSSSSSPPPPRFVVVVVGLSGWLVSLFHCSLYFIFTFYNVN